MNNYIKINKDKYSNNLDIPYNEDFGYLLKKYSWMIRKNPRNVKGRFYFIHKHKFSKYSLDILNHLLSSDDELKEIYNLRNMYQSFNSDNNIISAKENLEQLIDVFVNHEIFEIRRYGRTLYLWFDEIVNSFTKHKGKRYNNGPLESRNRQIKTILKNAYGFKNFVRFRARVMYSINKDIPIRIKSN